MSYSLNNVYELKNKQHIGKDPIFEHLRLSTTVLKEYTATVDLITNFKRPALLGFIMIKGPCIQPAVSLRKTIELSLLGLN